LVPPDIGPYPGLWLVPGSSGKTLSLNIFQSYDAYLEYISIV